MHLLSSGKYLFNGIMAQVFRTLVFPVNLAEATCISCFRRYPSAGIPGYEVFSHPSWALKYFFLEGFKVFCVV